MDSPGVGLTPKAMLYQQRPHTGEAEFVGIALPVDINMIFEVIQSSRYSQTSIIRSVRDRQIFFELSIVGIFEISTSRKCSVVFVQY